MVCLKGMWGNFDDKENKAQNICLPAQSLQSLKPKQKKWLFFPLPKMEIEMKEMELPNFTIRPGYEAVWKLKKANSIKSFQHQLSLLALPRLVQSLKKRSNHPIFRLSGVHWREHEFNFILRILLSHFFISRA